jgi:hypothetical protein
MTGEVLLAHESVCTVQLKPQPVVRLFQVNKNEEDAKLEEPGLNMELMYAVHDSLREMVS